MAGLWEYVSSSVNLAIKDTWVQLTGGAAAESAIRIVLLLLPVGVFLSLEKFSPHLSRENPSFLSDMMLTILISSIAYLLVYVFVFIIRVVFVSPYKMWTEAGRPDTKINSFYSRKIEFIDDVHMIAYQNHCWAANAVADLEGDPEFSNGIMRIWGLNIAVKAKGFRQTTISKCWVKSHQTGEVLVAEPITPSAEYPVRLGRGDYQKFVVKLNSSKPDRNAPRNNPLGMRLGEFRNNWLGYTVVIEIAGCEIRRSYEQSVVDWLLYRNVVGLHWSSVKEPKHR